MKRKSFGIKLWSCFILFAAVIFAILWLLQTVFLQKFYSDMAISNLKKTASAIAKERETDSFWERIDQAAESNSFLIFLIDENNEIVYSVDEYSAFYEHSQADEESAYGNGNPYLQEEETLNWQKGAVRNLPYSHSEFIDTLRSSDVNTAGYTTEDGTAYVYGLKLSSCKLLSGEKKDLIMCISMPLSTVSAATDILRMQLLWVLALSLLVAFVLSYFMAKKFEKPISDITEQSKKISRGEFHTEYPKGFCSELDELSDVLGEMALSIEELENCRREFLANISHDLRTPLTMIKGYAEMIQEISWSDDEKRNQDLAVIKRETNRLTNLVNEIMEYTSMPSALKQMEKEDFDLSSTAETVITQFEPLCHEHGYLIEKSIEQNIWMRGNKMQMERVIYNFIDNALNHTGKSGKITVSLYLTGTRARFSVKDYGPGIPESQIPYIWERYYTSRNRKNKGTVSGLGLSIAREILSAHEAEFGVECKDGCVFWFEIKT